ncbi:MAG: hypothetical protein ACUZ8E_04135 [Candidatus Anammoxibacter sp.]
MATYAKQLQRIVTAYMKTDQPWPASTREMAAWAVRKNLWRPQPADVVDQCANQLSRAMREEHITDPQGRIVRAKHVARYERNGVQTSLWGDIRTANRQHMQIAFQQRRQQVVGDCRQLKTDLDSYNENRNQEKPIQMSFDFTFDLEELEALDNVVNR